MNFFFKENRILLLANLHHLTEHYEARNDEEPI